MGLIIGMFKLILRIILVLSALAAFILLIPNLPPYTKFTSIKVEPTLERSGSLAYNNILNQPAQLYKDKLLGPECFQVWNDELYTSLATGEIVKLSRGRHVTFVTKIGQPCTGLTQEHICGRPLGFVIDEKKKNLIVADAYYGIWKVSLESDKKQLLVSPNVAIDGTVPMLFNSVALASNGDIYWTHSSSDFHLKDGVFAIFSDPSGRLLHYNPAKNESKVLLDDLWFANGLAISPDNQFVVVAETSRYKLTKYYISGPKKGKSEVFVSGLPGLPDTVRPLPDGSGILVSLYNVFDDENPLIMKSMSETPLVRKFIARLLRLIEIPFEYLQTHFDNHVFESIVHYIGHFSSASAFSTGLSGLVQIDWNGNIVASYYNTDGGVSHISDAIVFNDQLLTGSPHHQDFVAAVPAPPLLKKAFAKPIKEEKAKVKAEQNNKPKVNEPEQAPRTTPKPVEKPKAQVNEPKEVPKTTPRPVEKEKPKVNEPKQATKAVPKPAEKPVEKVKPKVVEPKEAPKTAPKPVEKAQPAKEARPVEAKQASQTKPTPAKTQQVKQDKVTEPKAEAKVVKQEKDSKAEVKPKVSKDAKVETPKLKVEPKAAEPKPKVQPKEEAVKPKPTEKPKVVQKEPEVKPTAAPKVESKPVVKDAKKDEPKTPKVHDKEKKSAKKTDESKPKPSEAKPQAKPKQKEQDIKPIEEEIPSDTIKPSKEKLKVIKKNGPQEIPNPNL